jgi:hypothetical protein
MVGGGGGGGGIEREYVRELTDLNCSGMLQNTCNSEQTSDTNTPPSNKESANPDTYLRGGDKPVSVPLLERVRQ